MTDETRQLLERLARIVAGSIPLGLWERYLIRALEAGERDCDTAVARMATAAMAAYLHRPPEKSAA